ncbi:MAG: hypothetical protein M1142_06750 [Patescibacteria group bacterium]|nr:hypothetical protein [Patescibacteria group bacterium]
MLTLDDIKKLTEVFTTRQDLEKLQEEMATKNDWREVMTMVDNVLGEVKAMREEQTAHYQQHEDIDQEITGIKRRLDKVENDRAISPTE